MPSITHFEEKLQAFIAENRLFTKRDKLLLAVSGGVDSLVMSEALHRLGYFVALAHVNHRLRGSESDEDEDFVRRYAESRGMPLWVQAFDTASAAAEQKQNMQQTARRLRYEWFDALCRLHGFTRILTAHHLGDALETTIYRLVKGGGINGLHGIPIKRGCIVRPLLAFDREEIVAYARALNLTWREDSSNRSDKYARNFIRHRIVPLLQKINPSAAVSFADTHQRLGDAVQWLKKSLKIAEKKCTRRDNNIVFIDINALERLPSPRFFLYEYLKKFGFNYKTASDIARHLHAQSGTRFISPTHSLTVNRSELIVSPLSDALSKNIVVVIPDFGTYPIDDETAVSLRLTNSAEPQTGDRRKIRVNRAALCFPLHVRPWQSGDRMQPFGMKGAKKISDLLIDLKVSLPEKKTVRVLCNAKGQILWLIGYRLAEICRITDTNAAIAEIEVFPIEERDRRMRVTQQNNPAKN